MTGLTFHLHASIARQYSVMLGQDLFGAWMLKTNFGRIGRKGTEISYTFSCKEEAYRKIKPLLKTKSLCSKQAGMSLSTYRVL